VARASVQGLFAKRAEFLRTPKTGEHASVWRVIQANWAETGLACLGAIGILAALSRVDTFSGPLLAVLLLVPTIGLAAAPANSLAAQRAMLPPELAARRRSEWRRDRHAVVAGTTAGLASAALVAAIVIVAALLTAPAPRVSPPTLRPPGPAAPAPSGSPAPSPSGATPSPPAQSPSPSAPSTGVPSPSAPPATSAPPAPSSSAPSTSEVPGPAPTSS
jgi:hypothetical protein